MTLALKEPRLISDVISVDNAPLDAALLSNFGKYIQGMKQWGGDKLHPVLGRNFEYAHSIFCPSPRLVGEH